MEFASSEEEAAHYKAELKSKQEELDTLQVRRCGTRFSPTITLRSKSSF
jgi:hypothetical protein